MRSVVMAAAMIVPAGLAWGQVTLGQHDTFQDGTTQGWGNGGPATDPTIVPNGGPGGAGDAYLRVASDGGGSGGKLTVFNGQSWWGNYVGAGVTRIEMDLINLDPQNRTLSIRLGFREGSNQGSPGYCTTAYSLPADGQWHHAVFTITQATMTRVGTAQDWTFHMSNVGELRIFHSPSASLTGVNIASVMGIDNITALPTPGAAAALGLAGAWASRRRRV